MKLTDEQMDQAIKALDKAFDKYKEIAGLTEEDKEVFKRAYFLGFLDAYEKMKAREGSGKSESN